MALAAAAGGAGWLTWRRHLASLPPAGSLGWAPGGGEHHRLTLAARRLGAAGTPVILLHGLGGSESIWGAAYDRLGEAHRVLALDLLGCGSSPHPETGYTLADHAEAVARTLAEAGLDDEPAIIVGHSFGSLIALALAVSHPGLVAGTVAICPPLFRNAAEARARTAAALTPIERFLYLPRWWAGVICRNVCMKRPGLAAAWGGRLRTDLPPSLVVDAIKHTWRSYSESMAELLGATARPEWLGSIRSPVRIIAGARDAMLDLDLLAELAARHAGVTLTALEDAGHLVPLTHAERCVAAVEALASPGLGPRSRYSESLEGSSITEGWRRHPA